MHSNQGNDLEGDYKSTNGNNSCKDLLANIMSHGQESCAWKHMIKKFFPLIMTRPYDSLSVMSCEVDPLSQYKGTKKSDP